jgi:hypothetical protein
VRGMAGFKNIWKIPEELHKFLHGGPGEYGGRGGLWNEAWWKELEKIGGAAKASVEQVVEIRDKLIKMFGLERFRP